MIVPPKTFSSKVMLQIISHSVCELGHRRSEALRWFSQMALHRTHAPRALREVVHLKVGRPKKVWLSPQNSRLGHTIPFWKRLNTPGPKIYDMVIGGLHREFHSSSIGKPNLTSIEILFQPAIATTRRGSATHAAAHSAAGASAAAPLPCRADQWPGRG